MKRLTACLPALALLCACTAGPAIQPAPTPDSSPDPGPAASPGPVFTDWSGLGEYRPPENLYTRYYEEPTPRLLPKEGGYGARLLPFAGAELATEWSWSEYLYGLATPDGTVVCDPVYDNIYTPGYSAEFDGYLALWRTEFEGPYDPEQYRDGQRVMTLAACDGSWVLEGDYTDVWPVPGGRVLLMDAGETLWLCDQEGNLEPSPLTADLSELWGDWWGEIYGFSGGIACIPVYDQAGAPSGCWFANALTGETKFLPELSSCYGWYDGDELSGAFLGEASGYLAGYLDRSGSWAIPAQFASVDAFIGDYARVSLPTGEYAVIDRTGAVVCELQGDFWNVQEASDGSVTYWDCSADNESRRWTVHAVYDSSLTPLDHPAVGRTLDQIYEAPAVRDGDLLTIYDGAKSYTVAVDAGLELYAYSSGLATFQDDGDSQGLYDCAAKKWIIPMGLYHYFYSASDGGRTVYWAFPQSSGDDVHDLLDENGAFIAHVGGSVGELRDGLVTVRDGLGSGWMDLEGNWVFRWLFPLGSD